MLYTVLMGDSGQNSDQNTERRVDSKGQAEKFQGEPGLHGQLDWKSRVLHSGKSFGDILSIS